MKEEYSNQQRRWYDKDPVLSSAMKTLEESDDETQMNQKENHRSARQKPSTLRWFHIELK